MNAGWSWCQRSERNCSRTAIFNPPCASGAEGEEVTRAPDSGGTPGEFQFLKSVTRWGESCWWSEMERAREKTKLEQKKSTQLKFTRSFPAKGLSKLNKNCTSCNLSHWLHASTIFFYLPLCLWVWQRPRWRKDFQHAQKPHILLHNSQAEGSSTVRHSNRLHLWSLLLPEQLR